MTLTAALLAVALLVLFSAFFSSVEIALTSLNRLRLEKRAEGGKKSAALALKQVDGYSSSLATLLVGNNLVNTAASAVATAFTLTVFADNEALGGVISSAVITVVLLIFGEIVPKIVGKRLNLGLACLAAYPLRVFMILFFPVTWLIGIITNAVAKLWRKKDAGAPTVTEEDLSTIIDTVEEEGVLDEDRGELLKSAFDFSDITVEQILTPRIDLKAVDLEDTAEEILPFLLESKHSRFPAYRDTIDHIVGIFCVSPFLKAVAEKRVENVKVEDFVMDTVYVHKTTKLPDALEKMRDEQIHMIVVLDEYGGTLGAVTMEDILEEIVGEIWDETDVIEDHIRKISPDTYEVLGQTVTDDLFDEIEFEDRDFESEYTTVGGWAVEMLEEEPHEGDIFTYKNLFVTVTEMGENLVEKLTVKVLPPSDEEDE